MAKKHGIGLHVFHVLVFVGSFTLGTAASGAIIKVNAFDTGWWDSLNGSHEADNSNYLVGNYDAPPDQLDVVFSAIVCAANPTICSPPDDPLDNTFNNYFAFNLGALPDDEVVVEAYLSIYNPEDGFSSDISTVPYFLFDVNTPIAELIGTDAGRQDIYTDLRSGVLYGGYSALPSDNDALISNIALNLGALTDINAAIDACGTSEGIGFRPLLNVCPFAIGGSTLVDTNFLGGGIPDLTEFDRFLFGGSGDDQYENDSKSRVRPYLTLVTAAPPDEEEPEPIELPPGTTITGPDPEPPPVPVLLPPGAPAPARFNGTLAGSLGDLVDGSLVPGDPLAGLIGGTFEVSFEGFSFGLPGLDPVLDTWTVKYFDSNGNSIFEGSSALAGTSASLSRLGTGSDYALIVRNSGFDSPSLVVSYSDMLGPGLVSWLDSTGQSRYLSVLSNQGPSPVPEPSTLLLLGLGLAGLGFARRPRKTERSLS